MATLTVSTTSRAGVNATDAAAAADAGGSDKWPNTGKEKLLIINGSANPYTATFPVQATPDGQAVASKTVTIAAGKTYLVGPFPTNLYNDAQNNCTVQHSATTTIKVLPFVDGN